MGAAAEIIQLSFFFFQILLLLLLDRVASRSVFLLLDQRAPPRQIIIVGGYFSQSLQVFLFFFINRAVCLFTLKAFLDWMFTFEKLNNQFYKFFMRLKSKVKNRSFELFTLSCVAFKTNASFYLKFNRLTRAWIEIIT